MADQQRNPLAPSTSKTVAEQLADYTAENSMVLGNAQVQTQAAPAPQATNNAMFADDKTGNMQNPENVSQLQEQIVNNSAFASQSPVNTKQMSQYDPEAAHHINLHLMNSKAYKAIMGTDTKPGPFREVLDHIKNQYWSGMMGQPGTPEAEQRLVKNLSEAGPMIEELVAKHHGHEDHKNMTRHPATYESTEDYDSVMGGNQ